MISDKDMVELSTVHAYVYYKQGDSFDVNGNDYYVVDIYNQDSGMKHGTDAMLVVNEYGEHALIYTGSDKRNDFVNDWILNNGRNLFKMDVPQYEEGNDLYNELSKTYDIERIGGVSLGGGIVTYIGINNPEVDVVSINPAPQVFKIDKEYNNILTITDSNDILYTAGVLGNRKSYFVDNYYTFKRGDTFFNNIKLNHIGYDKKKGLYLDESITFDLLTNNINSNVINVTPDDITTINTNLRNYFDNSSNEINVNIIPHLKNVVSNYRDNISYNKIITEIIYNIKSYMERSLPTLHNYIDFSSFYDELIALSNSQSYFILDALLNEISTALSLDAVRNQIYTDSNSAISNTDSIINHVNNITTTSDKLIQNIKLRDMYMTTSSECYIEPFKLMLSNGGRNLRYLYLFEHAKELMYLSLKPIITSKFSVIDYKIDFIISILKSQVSILGDVVGLVSKEIASRIEIVEQILQELYIFDIGTAVYEIFVICIEEIISIVLPKEVGEQINALKYLNQVLTNSYTMYCNYNSYLSKFKSYGMKTLLENTNLSGSKINEYNNSLSAKYS